MLMTLRSFINSYYNIVYSGVAGVCLGKVKKVSSWNFLWAKYRRGFQRIYLNTLLEKHGQYFWVADYTSISCFRSLAVLSAKFDQYQYIFLIL